MSFRLQNQNDPNRTLSFNEDAWFGILDLAEDYGWNPMGTLPAESWLDLDFSAIWEDADDFDPWVGSYTSNECRLVAIEDALNLADALELAFLEYEPERVQSLMEISMAGRLIHKHDLRPGIGAIMAVMEFCRYGAFWIERM